DPAAAEGRVERAVGVETCCRERVVGEGSRRGDGPARDQDLVITLECQPADERVADAHRSEGDSVDIERRVGRAVRVVAEDGEDVSPAGDIALAGHDLTVVATP